jgi:hypothetical protein
MDIVNIIRASLESWEQEKADAIARYNKASIAIETLKELTDRMLQESINDHENSEPSGAEVTIKERAGG